MSDKGKKFAGAAAVIMPAMVLSRITGFLRNVLITSKMSPQGYSDEFYIALKLPELMFELLVGGAIAAALIPVLSAHISKNREEYGWKAVSTFINISVLVMIVLGLLGIFFTPALIHLIAAGFKENMNNFRLTVALTRCLIPSALFMMLAGQCNAILNSYHKFVVAAYGPVIYNICFVTGIIIFGSKSAHLTALSVTLSSAIYFIFQFSFSLKYLKNQYKFKIFIKHKAFNRLVKLALPALLSSTLVYVNTIISTSFTTMLSKGKVTALTNANRTWMLPLGVFAQSIGIAMLPTLSKNYASMDKMNYKKVLLKAVRMVLLLAIPSALGMFVLNQEIMRTLFKWSQVGEQQVIWGGAALMAFSIAIVYSSLILLMNRAFFSIHNSQIPLYTNILSVIINFLLTYIFMKYTFLDIAGMALAYTIAVTVNGILLVFLFKVKTGIDIAAYLPVFILKVLIASIFMIGNILLLDIFIKPDINSKISQAVSLGIKVCSGVFVFYIAALLLKLKEVQYFTGLTLIRIKKAIEKV